MLVLSSHTYPILILAHHINSIVVDAHVVLLLTVTICQRISRSLLLLSIILLYFAAVLAHFVEKFAALRRHSRSLIPHAEP